MVDKDLASAIVAHEIGARDFFILMNVRTVFLNFGKEDEMPVDNMTERDALQHLKNGQFEAGSMEPKISAAVDFIEKGGKRVIISAIDAVPDALKGLTGTVITP